MGVVCSLHAVLRRSAVSLRNELRSGDISAISLALIFTAMLVLGGAAFHLQSPTLRIMRRSRSLPTFAAASRPSPRIVDADRQGDTTSLTCRSNLQARVSPMLTSHADFFSQKGRRNSRFKTLPAPDSGSGSSRTSTLRGHL